MLVSFVIPVKEEQDSISELCEKIIKNVNLDYEIILIDDGSKDNSWDKIKNKSTKNNKIKGIRFRTNRGKSEALMAGFENASGDIIITLDADLQDDPSEIPRFIEKINEGFDMVSGWKKKRKDPLNKTLPSKIFNFIVAKVFKLNLHDFNCGFKAYTKEAAKSVNIYGELHRFIPAILYSNGFNITEIEVLHNERKFGVSKYGWKRLYRGFIDLFTVLGFLRYTDRPGHLFGGLGAIFGMTGLIFLLYLTTLWFLNYSIGTRPLLILSVLLMMVGIQLISLGMLSEMIYRNTGVNESKIFKNIKEKINI